MKFSERIGKRPLKTIQLDSIDDDLKNRLWNTILDDFFSKLSTTWTNYRGQETTKGRVCEFIWKDFLNNPLDEIPRDYTHGNINVSAFLEQLKHWFYKAEWLDIYDLVDFAAKMDTSLKTGFTDKCNLVLQREVSGYRIINGVVAQITSETEIKEIEEAISETDKWESVNTHLQTALDMLADRKNPDYRNSIKESISAVESLCKIITNDNKATLANALSKIEKTHSIHKALKTAFSSLYGYTSDSGGIRHALIESDVKVDFEEAKFMLVTCSAFINYLKNKMAL